MNLHTVDSSDIDKPVSDNSMEIDVPIVRTHKNKYYILNASGLFELIIDFCFCFTLSGCGTAFC